MSRAHSPTETARGYAAPSVTQFNIFLANRVGRLHELVKGFDEHRARICAMGVHEASDHAVIRIVSNNADEGRKILDEQNLPYMESQVLIVSLETGHALSQCFLYLLQAELSIRFAYPVFGSASVPTAMVLAVDDLTLAGQILRKKEFKLLAEADLPKFGE